MLVQFPKIWEIYAAAQWGGYVEKPLLDGEGNEISKEKIFAPDFFNHCVNGRLSEDDFELISIHTTPIKIEILPRLMERDISVNQIVEFNANGLLLECDRIAESVKACLEMKRVKDDIYVVQIALSRNVREYTKWERHEPICRTMSVYTRF